MIWRKNRFISGFLAFVMVLTVVLGIIPPVEVSAIESKALLDEAKITSPSVSKAYYYGDDITLKWSSVSGATYYKVAVRDITYGENDNPDMLVYSKEKYTSLSRSITLDADNFEEGHKYKFAVGAYSNTTEPKSWGVVRITIEEAELLEETEITSPLSSKTYYEGDDIEFTWDDVSGATYYKVAVRDITYGENDDPDMLVYSKEKYTSSSRSITLDADNFEEGHKYKFAVGAYSEYSEPEAWGVVKITIKAKITVPTILERTIKISDSVTLGDNITYSATIDGNGAKINKVNVGIYSRVINDSVYFPISNLSTSTYNLSGSVTTGEIVKGYDVNGNAKTLDMSYPGEYTVTLHATTVGGGYNKSESYVVSVKEPSTTDILGDVNSDGCVSDMDQFVFKRYLDNVSGYTVDTIAADINGNGKVTIDDFNILKNYLVANNGYNNLYDFCNRAGATSKPKISGVNQVYYVEKGSSLKIPFTLTAQNSGKIEKMTLKHNLVGTAFSPISYTCNQSSYSNSFTISGYPLNQIGLHTFVIYCRASNYTVTNNEIIIFNVYVTEKECSHDNYDDQYLRTVYVEKHKTLVEHTYYHEYKSVCKDCGYEICTVAGDSVTEGHKLNAKGYCLCGYINTRGYAIWEGYNSSGKNITVYSNPEATSQYGLIYANESVTVLGECCGRYLIEYDLDSGGTKQGYVAKNNVSEYVNNTTSARYSLAIDDEYFFEEDGRKIWFVEQYGYSKVHITDNNTGSKVAYSQNNSLKWSLKYNNNDSIDKYGTLCMRSAPGEINILELYYDGELIDSIECWVVNENTRLTTMDCVENWKAMKINDYCIITDYKSVYNAANNTYTVTMKVYNKSPVVFGIGSMSENTKGWHEFRYINTDWDDFSLVDKSVETFEMFAGAFTASDPLVYIAYLEDAEETNIELTVPAGGRIVFVGSADDNDVFIANIAELVISILATSDDFVALLGKPIKASNIRNMISNATFFNKIKAALINIGLDELIKSAMSNKDAIHVMRDIISIISDPNNKDELKQLMITVADCYASAGKDIAVDVAKKIELLCERASPAFLIVQGSDTVLSCLETIDIIASNVNIIKNEKTYNEIGFLVKYPNK